MARDPAGDVVTPDPVDGSCILLVEDNPHDAELTTRALRKANVLNPMVVVPDGELALDYLIPRRHHSVRAELPLVVLLDLALPKMSGLEVLRIIRETKGLMNLSVIVLTSSKDQEEVLQSFSLGAVDFIRKPIDFARFASVIARLGVRWLLVCPNAK